MNFYFLLKAKSLPVGLCYGNYKSKEILKAESGRIKEEWKVVNGCRVHPSMKSLMVGNVDTDIFSLPNLSPYVKIFQVGHNSYDLLPMIIGTCLVYFDLLNGIWLLDKY